jgi:multiple inositol-polyphosphate phosphatase/2,3-bisphosphoglycerate 3-phosphatase
MNRTKNLLHTLLCTTLCLVAATLHSQYALPLGTKTLYTPGNDTAALPPTGYTPFFINYVGRHGARHATGTGELIRLDQYLQTAADSNALRPDGIRLQKMVRAILTVEKKYPSGTLTAVGETEQYRIGRDMGERYPQVVRQPEDCLQVISTPEQRTVQSADQFLKGLASASTCITRTPDDSVRLRFFSLSPGYKDFEKKGDWKKAQAQLESADPYHAATTAILHRFFDSTWTVPENFIMTVYAAAVIAPGLKEELRQAGYKPGETDIFSLLSPKEAEALSTVEAARDFFVKGPGLDAEGIQVRVAAPLLADFIQSTDEWLATGKSGADLRFAHAETIAPIAALMGCEGASTAVTDPFRYPDVWRSDRLIGYSANIQWIFYHRSRNGDDYLLKVLYNEHPIHLPIATGSYPFYRWKDVREYYLRKLYTLDASPGKDLYGYLRALK